MELADLNKAIARRRNQLIVSQGSVGGDAEYADLLAQREALLNPPAPKPKASQSKPKSGTKSKAKSG